MSGGEALFWLAVVFGILVIGLRDRQHNFTSETDNKLTAPPIPRRGHLVGRVRAARPADPPAGGA